MKDRLAPMVLAKPARFHADALRFRFVACPANKYFLQSRETLGKIGEELRGNLTFVAARAENPCYQDPAWSFGTQFCL
jgi:hypothetical protein